MVFGSSNFVTPRFGGDAFKIGSILAGRQLRNNVGKLLKIEKPADQCRLFRASQLYALTTLHHVDVCRCFL